MQCYSQNALFSTAYSLMLKYVSCLLHSLFLLIALCVLSAVLCYVSSVCFFLNIAIILHVRVLCYIYAMLYKNKTHLTTSQESSLFHYISCDRCCCCLFFIRFNYCSAVLVKTIFNRKLAAVSCNSPNTVNAITTVRPSTNRIFSSSLLFLSFFLLFMSRRSRFSIATHPLCTSFIFHLKCAMKKHFCEETPLPYTKKNQKKSVKRNQNSIEFQKDVNNQLEMLDLYLLIFIIFVQNAHHSKHTNDSFVATDNDVIFDFYICWFFIRIHLFERKFFCLYDIILLSKKFSPLIYKCEFECMKHFYLQNGFSQKVQQINSSFIETVINRLCPLLKSKNLLLLFFPLS